MLGNEYSQYKAIADGMTAVRDLISFYVNFDILYMQDSSGKELESSWQLQDEKTATERLEEALIEVYGHIISFLAAATVYFGMHEGADKQSTESKLERGSLATGELLKLSPLPD